MEDRFSFGFIAVLTYRAAGMVAWKQSKNRVIACLYLLVESYVVLVFGDNINPAIIVYVYTLY